jgi:predicted Zn-dependent peptidase
MSENDIIKSYENGLKTVIRPMPGFRTVTTSVLFGAGSANETKKQHGLSHLLEHSMFSGEEAKKELKSGGADYNAYTAYEETVYSAYGIESSAELCNKYLSHLVFKNDITKDYFKGEQKIVCQEIKDYEYDNKSNSETLAWSNYFKGTPYEHDIAGTTKDVMGFTIDDVKNYKKENYALDNMVVGIAGNITVSEAERLIKEYWLSNIADFVIKSKVSEELNFTPLFREVTKNNRNMTQHNATIMMPTFGHGTEINVLRRLVAYRLFQKVREDKKLVYEIGTSTDSTKIGKVMDINFKTTAGNTKQVFEIIANELKGIKSGEISEKELEIAKNLATYGTSAYHESVDNNSDLIVNDLYKYGKVPTIDSRIEKIAKVNLGNVRDCAKYCLKTNAATVAVIGPEAEKLKPIEYLQV